MRKTWQKKISSKTRLLLCCACALMIYAAPALSQDLSLPEDDLSLPQEDNSLPPAPAVDDQAEFEFNSEEFEFEKSPEDLKKELRTEAYDAALQSLLPLNPDEIRTLIERYDRTQESVALPVYPAPKPEFVVESISLDPGTPPKVIKLAYGHVTTVTFVDETGAPWPVENISWAGNFSVIETEASPDQYTHVLKISPESEFAYGNMSIDMLALQTPIIITLEANRDIVHYRFDAVIPDYGPLAKAPIINTGGMASTGNNKDMSSALEGVFPQGSVRMDVSGVDRRTSAYRYNGRTYVRTPLTLLSPAWSSSVSSADGTKVYEIDNAPVLLLSDRGQMVQAQLSDREELLDE